MMGHERPSRDKLYGRQIPGTRARGLVATHSQEDQDQWTARVAGSAQKLKPMRMLKFVDSGLISMPSVIASTSHQKWKAIDSRSE